jgi:hypothetical protein
VPPTPDLLVKDAAHCKRSRAKSPSSTDAALVAAFRPNLGSGRAASRREDAGYVERPRIEARNLQQEHGPARGRSTYSSGLHTTVYVEFHITASVAGREHGRDSAPVVAEHRDFGVSRHRCGHGESRNAGLSGGFAGRDVCEGRPHPPGACGGARLAARGRRSPALMPAKPQPGRAPSA